TLRNEGCILTMITVCFLPFLRKAISRSGLHYLGPPQPSLPPASNGPTKELRTCVDWTVRNAHCVLTLLALVSFAVCCVWILCVLLCPLYSLFKKSAPRRKCAACKIVVHTGCMERACRSSQISGQHADLYWGVKQVKGSFS
uniref:Uncharacterized protein n=1 Tax=Pundamilia nyererei TaxID=303518 RepID=A0A3B4GZR4_9CICH